MNGFLLLNLFTAFINQNIHFIVRKQGELQISSNGSDEDKKISLTSRF